MGQFLQMYEQMGGETFSMNVGKIAPYFATIDPAITDYTIGYCEVFLRKQAKVHNHLGTVHAIAMCNAAELAAGMVTDASIPSGARWIPEGMSVRYLAKAKTDLRVICDARAIDFSKAGATIVPVTALDVEGKECFTAEITMNVKLA